MTDDRQTSLTEFDGQAAEADGPTPSRNAADIEHLVGMVEELTDHVGTLAAELEERPQAYRAEDIESETQLRGYQ